MIRSVTLLGSSSGRNAGDAALLSAIMDSCDETCGNRLLYEIPSLKPEFIWQTYSNRVRPIGILPWNASLKLFGIPTYQSLMRTDLSLIFDATLFDRSFYNPFFNFMSSYDLLLPHAKRRGKFMACYTVTIGPVRTQKGKDMLRRILEMMDFITVRDQDSLDDLRGAGVENPNVLITNDCALNTRPSDSERLDQIFSSLGLPRDKDILALNVNPYFDSWTGLEREKLTREQFVSTYVRGVERAVKDIDATLLFVSTQHLDEALTKEIMSRLRVPQRKILFSNRVYSHNDVRGVMAHVNLLFAMRLHCLILTSAGHSPVIALGYLPKVETYLKSLGLADYTLSFANFSEDSVAAHLAKGWQEREAIRSILAGQIPRMQCEAHKAARLVAALHYGEDITRAVERLRNEQPGQGRLENVRTANA